MSDYSVAEPQFMKAVSKDFLTITDKVELLIDDIAYIEGEILPMICQSMQHNLNLIEDAAQIRESIIRQIEAGVENISFMQQCHVIGIQQPKQRFTAISTGHETYYSHVNYIQDTSNWTPQLEYVQTKSGQEVCYPANVRVGCTESCSNVLKKFQDVMERGFAAYIANAFTELGLCDELTARRILEKNNARPESTIVITSDNETVIDSSTETDTEQQVAAEEQQAETSEKETKSDGGGGGTAAANDNTSTAVSQQVNDKSIVEKRDKILSRSAVETWVYDVQSDRTVDSIADQYGLNAELICELNGLDAKNSTRLPAGTKLKLPLIIAAGGAAAAGGIAYAVHRDRKSKEAETEQNIQYEADDYKNFGLIEEEM